MKTYIIFKKDKDIRVVPDSVNLWAAIFNFVWIAYNRLWILLLAFFLYTVSISYLKNYGYINYSLYSFMILITLPYLWAYGNRWRQKKLMKQGFKMHNVVIAKNTDEAMYKAFGKSF